MVYACDGIYYSAWKRNKPMDLCNNMHEPQKHAEQKKPDTAEYVYIIWFRFWEIPVSTERICTVGRPGVLRDGGDCWGTRKLWRWWRCPGTGLWWWYLVSLTSRTLIFSSFLSYFHVCFSIRTLESTFLCPGKNRVFSLIPRAVYILTRRERTSSWRRVRLFKNTWSISIGSGLLFTSFRSDLRFSSDKFCTFLVVNSIPKYFIICGYSIDMGKYFLFHCFLTGCLFKWKLLLCFIFCQLTEFSYLHLFYNWFS